MKQLPLFLAFFLAGCQTLTIGMNPAPDARGFLDSLKNQDVAALDASVTDSASKEKKEMKDTLSKVKETDTPAADAARKWLSELDVADCYMGSDRSLCKLNNESELVLKRDGFAWKVDLSQSNFAAKFSEEMQGLFRADQTPEYVTIQFTLALLEGNLEQAREYSTDRTHIMLPLIVGMMSAAQNDQSEEQKAKMEEARKELKSMQCEINGDRAECAPEGKEKSMSLVRDNGIWKVDFKKLGEDEKEDSENEESMEDSDS